MRADIVNQTSFKFDLNRGVWLVKHHNFISINLAQHEELT